MLRKPMDWCSNFCGCRVLAALGLLMCAMSLDAGMSPGFAETALTAECRGAARQARGHMNKWQYDKARTVLASCLDRDASNPDALAALGVLETRRHNHAEAGKAFDGALTVRPDHKQALLDQAMLFLKMNRVADARGNLEQLETLCPGDCVETRALKQAIRSSTDLDSTSY